MHIEDWASFESQQLACREQSDEIKLFKLNKAQQPALERMQRCTDVLKKQITWFLFFILETQWSILSTHSEKYIPCFIYAFVMFPTIRPHDTISAYIYISDIYKDK